MKRVGLAILSLSAALFAQDNLAFWTKYKVISVNTKASGANVPATVAKFPVLVRLDASNANDVFTEALNGGADIRFGNAAGAARPFQIESWDAVAKKAAIWVLADSVKGNDSVATLRLYWGRAGQVSASNGPAVFDTANDWRVVYHMNGGTSTTEQDATIHGFNLAASDTVVGAVPGDTVGAVGGARVFAGDSTTLQGRQYFVAPGTAGAAALNIGANNPHTVSAWVYARAINPNNGSGNSIFNKGDKQYAMQVYGGAGTTGKKWESAVFTGPSNSGWRQAPSRGANPAAAGAWYHITGTWSGGANSGTGTATIYVNGVLDSVASGLAINTPAQDQAYNLFVGANPSGGGTNEAAPGTARGLAKMTSNIQRPRYWNGYLDEISLSRGVRDSNFIKLTYQTQKPTANAVVLGSTQTQTVVNVALAKFGYADTNKAADTLSYLAGTSISLPALVRGGPVDSFKVVGANQLPAGITVNKSSGLLSGSAAATAAANYTVRAWGRGGASNAVDSISRTVRLTIVSAATLSYAKDTVTYVKDLAITPNVATFAGATPTYTVAPALPAGLTLNASSGLISGTPTAEAAAANYTVKAKTNVDSAQKVLRITVVSAANEAYATAWSVHKDIWLNTQGNGAQISSGVGKFPVLVRFDANVIGTGTLPLASGADFRFTKEGDAVRLPHEIESWDLATKTGTAWVRVDTILPNNGTQKIRLHWGNASAPSVSSGPSVFDTAAGFQAVWHLNGTANEADATVNGFTAVAANAPTTGAGAIGPARVLNGTNQYFSVPNSASGVLNFKQTHSYTLSSWINPSAIATAANTGHKIIDKGDNQYVLATYGPDETTRYWEITIKGNNTWNQCQADGTFPGSTAILASGTTNAWNHLVGTYTGGAVGSEVTQRLYWNGKLVNECKISNTDSTGRTETYNVHLGVQAAGTAPGATFSRYFQGSIDEPRLANKARSADWVKLEYYNQKSTAGNNLVSWTLPAALNGAMASMAARGLSFKPSMNGLQFQVGALAAGEKAVLSLVDAWGRTVFSGAFDGNRLNWNGRANNGQEVSAGVYVARVKILAADGRANKVLEHRVPFTR